MLATEKVGAKDGSHEAGQEVIENYTQSLLKSLLWSHKGRNLYYNQNNPNDLDDEIRCHIYILNDEEIKEGDYFISGRIIHQYKGETLPELKQGYRKIIATTDTSLSQTSRKEIPQPSQSFIKKYIEEYNKGSVIENVLVEYEKEYQVEHFHNEKRQWIKDPITFIETNKHWFKIQDKSREVLKVDSDNTITIKKIKEIYSREEILSIVIDSMYFGAGHGSELTSEIIKKWIKDNL
jgi:hypothetical protein